MAISRSQTLVSPRRCPILPGHCAEHQTILLPKWLHQKATISLSTGKFLVEALGRHINDSNLLKHQVVPRNPHL
jgi:hypothetical protein